MFAKQGDAHDFFKDMLSRYHDGQRISEDDSKLLGELLERHPDDDKIGPGVSFFYRAKSLDHPTSGFHVMQVDDNWTDFSYITCIKGEKPTVYDYFYRACRSSVSPYLTQKKNSLFDAGPVFCSVTGQPVTKDSSEYKHTTPAFRELVDRFAKTNGTQIEWSLFPPDRNRQYSVRFVDSELENKFVAYHMANANLAIVKKGVKVGNP